MQVKSVSDTQLRKKDIDMTFQKEVMNISDGFEHQNCERAQRITFVT